MGIAAGLLIAGIAVLALVVAGGGLASAASSSQAAVAASPAATGTSTSGGLAGGQSASALLAQIPGGTFASNVITNGLQPQVLAAVLWAKTHGWSGQVISGFRTLAQQTAIYNSGVRPAAVPGTSEHEKGAAVDVSDPSGFAAALANAPSYAKLIEGTAFGDPNHFSINGH